MQIESKIKLVSATGSDYSANGNTLLGVDGIHKAGVQKVNLDVVEKANQRSEKVAVVGNESAAVSGALTMLFYASEVHLVAEKIQVSEKFDFQIRESAVQIHEGRKVKEIAGENHIERLVLDNNDKIQYAVVVQKKGKCEAPKANKLEQYLIKVE